MDRNARMTWRIWDNEKELREGVKRWSDYTSNKRQRERKKEQKRRVETMRWSSSDRLGYPINKCMFTVTRNKLDKQTCIYPLQFHTNVVIKKNLSTKKTMLIIKIDPENIIVFKSGFFSHTYIYICGHIRMILRRT